jgi:hypothetical protein
MQKLDSKNTRQIARHAGYFILVSAAAQPLGSGEQYCSDRHETFVDDAAAI